VTKDFTTPRWKRKRVGPGGFFKDWKDLETPAFWSPPSISGQRTDVRTGRPLKELIKSTLKKRADDAGTISQPVPPGLKTTTELLRPPWRIKREELRPPKVRAPAAVGFTPTGGGVAAGAGYRNYQTNPVGFFEALGNIYNAFVNARNGGPSLYEYNRDNDIENRRRWSTAHLNGQFPRIPNTDLFRPGGAWAEYGIGGDIAAGRPLYDANGAFTPGKDFQRGNLRWDTWGVGDDFRWTFGADNGLSASPEDVARARAERDKMIAGREDYRQWYHNYGVDPESLHKGPYLANQYTGPREATFADSNGMLRPDAEGRRYQLAVLAKMTNDLGVPVTPENMAQLTGVEFGPNGKLMRPDMARRLWLDERAKEKGLTPRQFVAAGYRVGPQGSVQYPEGMAPVIEGQFADAVHDIAMQRGLSYPVAARIARQDMLMSRGVYLPPGSEEQMFARGDPGNAYRWRDDTLSRMRRMLLESEGALDYADGGIERYGVSGRDIYNTAEQLAYGPQGALLKAPANALLGNLDINAKMRDLAHAFPDYYRKPDGSGLDYARLKIDARSMLTGSEEYKLPNADDFYTTAAEIPGFYDWIASGEAGKRRGLAAMAAALEFPGRVLWDSGDVVADIARRGTLGSERLGNHESLSGLYRREWDNALGRVGGLPDEDARRQAYWDLTWMVQNPEERSHLVESLVAAQGDPETLSRVRNAYGLEVDNVFRNMELERRKQRLRREPV
jgi:hypothetical protein